MKHYQILQLNVEYTNVRNLLFMSLDAIKEHKLLVCRAMYNEVYEGDIEGEDTLNTLEALYVMFNANHPADFKGHSMSVSDVVVLDGVYWYCDNKGFKKIEL